MHHPLTIPRLPARRRATRLGLAAVAATAIAGCATTDGASSTTTDTVGPDRVEASAPTTSTSTSTSTSTTLTTGTDTVIVDGPEATTIDRFAVIAFTGTSTQCRLDDAELAVCTSPVFLPDVGLGSHRFEVHDEAGTAVWEWEVLDLWDHPTDDLIAATKQPDPAEPHSWRGIFRINCDFSHSSYDDPIVYPGEEGAAHLHRFYGNTSVDFATTAASLYQAPASTCQGDELNASAYWIPALLTPDPGSTDEWAPVPAVVGNDDVAHEVFYYSAGVDDLSSIQPIPVGLRMIAGAMSATPDDPQSTSVVRWHCQSWESNDATNPHFSATIPACEAPDRVRMDIFFPSCWNGVDLDSDDHRSHMAYPVTSDDGEVVCPDSHPVPIVRPSYHYAFGVKPDVYDPATRSSTGWRLASDTYTVDADTPGGASLHADWFNGWHPSVMEAILEVCIQGRLDCHDGNLANGFRLGDVVGGVQNDPEVVNEGRGDASGAPETS